MAVDCRRPRRIMGAFCALLAGALSFSTPMTANTKCEEIRAWAVANYAGSSPTLDEFVRLDRPHRIAAFGALTSRVRSDLWQEQLRRFARRDDLTYTQRALIREAQVLMAPEVYAHEPGTQKAVAELRKRVLSAFTATELRRGWFDLGAALPGVQSPTIGLAPWCQCNQVEDDCWGGRNCGPAACTPFGPGCGFFQSSACDGMCE